MRRVRRAGRKEHLARLARRQYQSAEEHELRGTTETISCDINDLISTHGCTCNVPSFQAVNYTDSKRASKKIEVDDNFEGREDDFLSEVLSDGTRVLSADLRVQAAVSCPRPLPRIIKNVVLVKQLHYTILIWKYSC